MASRGPPPHRLDNWNVNDTVLPRYYPVPHDKSLASLGIFQSQGANDLGNLGMGPYSAGKP